MNPTPRDIGWIEVITGPMFSGKSEELIRRCRLATIAKQNVVVFKPAIDTRAGATEIVSRADVRLACVSVDRPTDIVKGAEHADVVGIDEGQFFNVDLVSACEELANAGKRVIVAGLDLDFRAEPFEAMARLMAMAEYVKKVLAICVVCGNPASRSQRLVESTSRFMVGDRETYEARCRRCFVPEGKGPHQEGLGID
ncbi:MAG: thymidine kinase [Deltaproteobacteria bacterium]|nr:thymidine kinase [Deltaproteobacteria bacterium]